MKGMTRHWICTCPIENLFMTYLETKQFNERYKEQEAIVFYDGQIQF